MTDPFDALRPPRRPLPVGGDDRAVTRGRRILHRRRAAAGGTAAAGLLAVGSVVAFNGSGSRPDSIGVLDPVPSSKSTPDVTDSGSVTPSPSARTSSARSPEPVGAPTLPPLPGQTPGPRPSRTTPPSTDRPYIGPEPTEDDGAAIYTETTYTDPNACLDNTTQNTTVQVGDTSGFCEITTGPAAITAGTRETLSITFCRMSTAGDVTLHFKNRFEALIWVYNGNHRYLGFKPVGAAHTQLYKAGDCTRYSTTWSGQDDDGFAFSEGRATISASLMASDYHDSGKSGPGMFSYTDVRWA